MQSSAWIALLQQVPVSYHDKLALVTVAGTEIAINSLVRLEEEYLLFRGRLSGTTDTGRAFFLPYDQINYLGFQHPIPEAELRAIYGETVEAAPPPAVTPVPETEEAPVAAADVTASPPKQTPPPELARTPLRPSVLGKNSILERLRARTHAGTTLKPPPAK